MPRIAFALLNVFNYPPESLSYLTIVAKTKQHAAN